MSISKEQIGHLARLARISITEAATAAFSARIDAIFGLITQMQTVDTHGVEPMSHPQEAALRLRADEVSASDRHLDFQRIAPQTEADLYLVPKVIE